MADQDSLTELELSKQPLEEKTQKGKGGRRRHAPDVGVWSIRGVEYETRTAFEKAADRVNKTIGQYLNEELRQYAQEQLKKGDQPPARQEDLRTEIDDIKSFMTQIASRSESDRQRDEEIRVIRETLEKRPASLREWLFGKK